MSAEQAKPPLGWYSQNDELYRAMTVSRIIDDVEPLLWAEVPYTKDDTLKHKLEYIDRLRRLIQNFGLYTPQRSLNRCKDYLAAFYHIVFKLSERFADLKLNLQTEERIKNHLVDNLKAVLEDNGRYRVGFIVRHHHQGTSNRYHSLHFHIILSRYRFPMTSEPRARRFKILSPEEQEQELDSYWRQLPLLTLTKGGPMEKKILKSWRRTQSAVLRKAANKNEEILWFSDERQGQDTVSTLEYIMNPGRKSLKNIDFEYQEDVGEVALQNRSDGSNPRRVDVMEFFDRYLFLPNQKGPRTTTKGHLHGKDSFNGVVQALGGGRMSKKKWRPHWAARKQWGVMK